MLTSFLAPQRKCGECKACCTAIAVQEIRKPFGAHCEHECDKGCAIYKDRPKSCAEYECGWLLGVTSFADRPDKVGYVIHHETDEHGIWFQIHMLRKISDDETLKLMQTTYNVVRMMEFAGIKIVPHDLQQNCSFEPDLVKYPDFPNIPGKTVWKTWDNIHYYLDAPKRKALKVVS